MEDGHRLMGAFSKVPAGLGVKVSSGQLDWWPVWVPRSSLLPQAWCQSQLSARKAECSSPPDQEEEMEPGEPGEKFRRPQGLAWNWLKPQPDSGCGPGCSQRVWSWALWYPALGGPASTFWDLRSPPASTMGLS